MKRHPGSPYQGTGNENKQAKYQTSGSGCCIETLCDTDAKTLLVEILGKLHAAHWYNGLYRAAFEAVLEYQRKGGLTFRGTGFDFDRKRHQRALDQLEQARLIRCQGTSNRKAVRLTDAGLWQAWTLSRKAFPTPAECLNAFQSLYVRQTILAGSEEVSPDGFTLLSAFDNATFGEWFTNAHKIGKDAFEAAFFHCFDSMLPWLILGFVEMRRSGPSDQGNEYSKLVWFRCTEAGLDQLEFDREEITFTKSYQLPKLPRKQPDLSEAFFDAFASESERLRFAPTRYPAEVDLPMPVSRGWSVADYWNDLPRAGALPFAESDSCE